MGKNDWVYASQVSSYKRSFSFQKLRYKRPSNTYFGDVCQINMRFIPIFSNQIRSWYKRWSCIPIKSVSSQQNTETPRELNQQKIVDPRTKNTTLVRAQLSLNKGLFDFIWQGFMLYNSD